MKQRPSFLVTAGSSREPIDRVRQWSNIFTGKTGLDIATALLSLGDVTLATSNPRPAAENQHRAGSEGTLTTLPFNSHADLWNLLEHQVSLQSFDAVFMTAAVSDYQPAGAFRVVAMEPIPNSTPRQYRLLVEDVQRDKIRSSHARMVVLGTPTPKLIDLFREPWGFTGLLVKFKLETGITDEELIEIASKSRKTSRADYIVANTLSMVDGPDAGAYIIGDGGAQRISRSDLASALVLLAQDYLRAQADK